MEGQLTGTSWWPRLRAVFGCVLGIVALFTSSGSSAASRAVPHVTSSLASPLNDDIDLCALLPSGEGIEVTPAPDSLGGKYQSCSVTDNRTSDKQEFFQFGISRAKSVAEAHGAVAYYDYAHIPVGSLGQKWVPTTAFGDPGYAFEMASVPPSDPSNPSNTQVSAKLVFARGQYVANGDAGWKDDANFTLIDAGKIEAIAAAVSGALPAGGPATTDTPNPTDTPFPTATSVETPTPTATLTPVDLTVDHIEVVQVVQDENNNAQLYAGKETLVRVFVGIQGATAPVPNVDVELRAFPSGNDAGVVIAARNSPFTAPPSPSRSVLSDTVVFDLPADFTTSSTYPIKVTVNPGKTISETTYDNNDLNKQLTFVEPFPLRIGYVRIGYTPPGSANVVWPVGPLQTYTSTMVNIYPTNDTELQYYELPNRLVYPGSLTGIDNKVALRDWLRERYNRLRSRRGEAAPDIVVGYLGYLGLGSTNVFTDAVGIAEVGTYAGELNRVVGGPAPTPTAIVAAPDLVGRVAWVIDYNGQGGVDSSPRVLAHEVGHILTLHHPGTNDTGLGSPCWARTINTFPGYWPRGTGQTWEIGYNHLTRDLVPDTDYDIMNYCAANLNWISMLDYKRLFDAMRRYNLNDPNLTPDLAWDDFLVSGSIASDGSSGSLDPLYRDTSSGKSSTAPGFAGYQPSTVASSNSPPAQQEQGDNCLRFTGANGTIAEHCFDLSFLDDETGQQLQQARFSLRVPYPQGVTGVELVRNGKQLDKRTASSNPPKLTITSPKTGDSWDGSQSLTWTASDPDGDALTYEVHYSPDGGDDWFPLELGLKTTQYSINTSDIAGGDKVLLRVLASDGFNTTQADVGPIKVPNSPPWQPPARPAANPPQNPPTQPGSGSGGGSNTWVLILLGIGFASLVGVALFATILLARRPRASQGTTGYPPPYPPQYTQQGPSIQPPPPGPPTSNVQPAPPVQRVPPPPPRSAPPSTTGVPQMPGNPFSSAQAQYARLRGELGAGRLNPQQFEAAISQIRVTDAQGRTWMLAPQTGQWLVYDGRAWVAGKPY